MNTVTVDESREEKKVSFSSKLVLDKTADF
jgi:hypothetical protein